MSNQGNQENQDKIKVQTKGYKQTEVGVIPEDWKVCSIKDTAPLQRGFDLTNSNLTNGNYPVVYSNGIINYHNKFQVNGPGVVTGRSGTIGKVHFVKDNFWPHNTSLWVTDFKGNIPLYIYYLYSSLKFKQFGTGSGVPTLNRNDLHNFKIPLPPTRTEQTAIATALSDMDSLIECLEKLLVKKRNIKQGAMQELLTGRKRLNHDSKDLQDSQDFKKSRNQKNPSKIKVQTTGYKQTEVGVIPEDWDVLLLNNIGDFYKGRNIPRAELTDEGVSCVLYGEIYTKYNFVAHLLKSKTSIKIAKESFEIKRGDLLFAGSGETAEDIGKCFSYMGDEYAVAGGDIVVLRPKDIFNSCFLGYILNTSDSANQKYYMGQGSSVYHIYSSNLKKLKIPLPPTHTEQTAIATALSDMDTEIEQLETKLSKYKMLKTGMMQELLTGKKRLNHD